MPQTVTGRAVVAAIVTVLSMVAVIALAAPLLARQHEETVLGDRLAGEARLVAELARTDLSSANADALDALAKRVATAARERVTIVAPDGIVLGESDEDRRLMENHAMRPEIAAARETGEGRSVRHSATVDRDLLYVAVAARAANGSLLGYARTALPLTAVDAFARQLAGVLVLVTLLAGAIALVVALLLGRALTRPIERLTALAAADSPDLDVRGPREVERLAATLRRMSAAIRDEHRAALAERDRLATLLDQLGDGVVIVTPHDRVSLANASAARLLATEHALGRAVPEVIRDHEILDTIARARSGGESAGQVERSEPRRFVRVLARRLESGEVLVVLQDLTALRRLQTVRSDFVANVSHELRAPIAALKAMTETLEEGALREPDVASDFVRRMHDEIDDLAQLVNELLTLTRIESGADRMDRRPVPPASLLRDAERRLGPLAERAGIRLEVAAGGPLPAVHADPDRIGQVLANLVHNAIKFSAAGSTVHLLARGDGEVVTFAVADEGVGIARDELDRIFERFYKSDRSRSGGGTGLGLAIAKHIVQVHGGEIRASSPGPGAGATFTFTLPIAHGPAT